MRRSRVALALSASAPAASRLPAQGLPAPASPLRVAAGRFATTELSTGWRIMP